MRGSLYILILLCITGLATFSANAQSSDREVIQFSGVVVEEDSSQGIPGVHIYVPGKRRGTSANYFGYFSFPVLEGDTITFSAVGFQRKRFIIPFDNEDDMLTVVVPLKSDTIILDPALATPFPTEELFKEAVLAMRPTDDPNFINMQSNLDPALLSEMYRNMPMDGSMNHTYFIQQQAEYMFDGYSARSNQYLNPFAWADFFKSLKKKK